MKNGLMVFAGAVGVVLVAVATMPWWGGCDLNAKRCSTLCSIKHFNNDMEAAGCRASCTMENARCHGEEAAEQLNDFLRGFQGK